VNGRVPLEARTVAVGREEDVKVVINGWTGEEVHLRFTKELVRCIGHSAFFAAVSDAVAVRTDNSAWLLT